MFKKANKSIEHQKEEDELGKQLFKDSRHFGVAVYFVEVVPQGKDHPGYRDIAVEDPRMLEVDGEQVGP